MVTAHAVLLHPVYRRRHGLGYQTITRRFCSACWARLDAVVNVMHTDLRTLDKRAIVVVLTGVYHKHPSTGLGVTCYGHGDVQYGTAVMTPNIRTHYGDTANASHDNCSTTDY